MFVRHAYHFLRRLKIHLEKDWITSGVRDNLIINSLCATLLLLDITQTASEKLLRYYRTVAFIREITSRIGYQAVPCPWHKSSLMASQADINGMIHVVSFDLD